MTEQFPFSRYLDCNGTHVHESDDGLECNLLRMYVGSDMSISPEQGNDLIIKGMQV